MSTHHRTQPASSHRVSRDGIEFIAKLEELPGTSDHVYWPRGSSGVTIGPGYDFLHRRPDEIQRDLEAIGVPQHTAVALAAGAKLSGTRAKDFARKHHDIVKLSAYQQQSLLQRIIPNYENVVRRHITVPIKQHEFDALVALTYNPGKSITSITNYINRGKRDDVIRDWSSRTHSNGRSMGALTDRRKREIALFLNGKYR